MVNRSFIVAGCFGANGICPVKVEDVHDGDTITVSDASKKHFKIRLIGVDAPELKQKAMLEAKNTKVGLWFDENLIDPKEFRQKKHEKSKKQK